jgi:hypothetical protein
MRKLQLSALVVAVAALTYVLMPLAAAWHIREAVRAGDTRALQERVDWPSVRQSLKDSVAEAREALRELAEAAGEPPPGLWQRIKSAAFPYLADPLIERYVTAEGVVRLHAWREAWRRRLAGGGREGGTREAVAGRDSSTRLSRAWTALGRVERLAFVAPTRVEIQVSDTLRPGRSWRATLELGGAGWRLSGIRILRRSPAPARARAAWAGGRR